MPPGDRGQDFTNFEALQNNKRILRHCPSCRRAFSRLLLWEALTIAVPLQSGVCSPGIREQGHQKQKARMTCAMRLVHSQVQRAGLEMESSLMRCGFIIRCDVLSRCFHWQVKLEALPVSSGACHVCEGFRRRSFYSSLSRFFSHETNGCLFCNLVSYLKTGSLKHFIKSHCC